MRVLFLPMSPKSIFRFCAIALICSAFSHSLADQQKLVVEIKGTPVGENVLTQNPDGSFDSESSLSLGSVSIKSFIKGHVKAGKLLDYTSETSAMGSTVTFSLSKGTLAVTNKGKTTTVPFNSKSGLYAGNYHPVLLAGMLQAALKAIQSNPATKAVEEKVFFMDVGAELPFKLDLMPDKRITVGGETKTIREFSGVIATVPCTLDMDESGKVVAFDVPSQGLRFIREGWDAIFEDPLKKYPEFSQSTYKVKTEKGVKMKTRDGVDLVSDVVRPDDGEKHPAILVRTPYGRGTEAVNGTFYASRGYVYVAQDCRGREDSGGDWDPFVNEGKDGYDAVQWVASQPWCDGNVGMIGGSYDGYVQWAAAVEKPPALKCIVPEVSPPDAMRNIPYDHGTFALYLNLWWAKIVAGKHTDFSTLRSSLPNPKGITTLPLSKTDSAVLGKHLDFYQKWLARPKLSDWKGWDYTYHLNNVDIPALHISGIWDGDEIGTHINWNTMRGLGRKNQWIVFGPWVHAFNTNHSFGGVEYGKDAIIDLDSLTMRWFDTWLKGKDVGLNKVAHVRLFVTGANKWVTMPDWPSQSMSPRTSYFSTTGLTASPGGHGTKTYTYDPAKDTKIPEAYLDVNPDKATTVVDLKILKKKIPLLLKTAPFKKDTAIAAPLSVNIYFKTSAQDTDFFALILDIDAKGVARGVGQSGKLRCSYLEGMDTIEPLTPGKTYKATLTPWDFAHEFKKGHRLAVLIVSSEFPVFARNLGYVQSLANGTKMQKQRNTILMDRAHPSSFSYYVLWEK
ncbi:MAG TPA: CocE/NonD family hydrolase [Fimbriimonadaceae bacterium]